MQLLELLPRLLLELLLPLPQLELLLLELLLLQLELLLYSDVSQSKDRGDRSLINSMHDIRSLACSSGTCMCESLNISMRGMQWELCFVLHG